jgi:RNA polymerase sigma factor (sigma-70 family)
MPKEAYNPYIARTAFLHRTPSEKKIDIHCSVPYHFRTLIDESMEQHANNDTRLLVRYVRDGSQAAFARLVERHINLVYSMCYRELRQRELAEEATQAVFIVLARKARGIRSEAALVSWLYTTARFEASVLRRQETRRMAQERLAAEELSRTGEQPNTEAWAGIEPALNDALAALPRPDRLAILLRFFEEKSLREVGLALGSSEDAARMRVTRALEKLRTALVQRRAADVSVTALAAILTAHAVHAVTPQVTATVVAASASSALAASATGDSGLTVHSLIGKGLAAAAKTKIVAGAVAVSAVFLGLTAVHTYHAHRASSRVVWNAPSSWTPATWQAEQEVQAQLGRMADGFSSGDVKKMMGVVSPGFRSSGWLLWSGPAILDYANFEGREAHMIAEGSPSMRITITSCRVEGDTAIAIGVLEESTARVQYLPAKRIGYRFRKSGGQWLCVGFSDPENPLPL